VWRSGCGTLVSSTSIETVKHVFDITTANGRVATGTLATMHYRTASACPDALPTHTTSLNVTLTIDPAATNITGVYTGAADKVVVSALGSMPSTIYVGFLDSMNGFYISNSTEFDDKRLLYSR
jgi:hypothetical protein